MEEAQDHGCNESKLLSSLTNALVYADQCDSVIAAHVAAAISRCCDLYPPPDQSGKHQTQPTALVPPRFPRPESAG
jgi:hypothetical protein